MNSPIEVDVLIAGGGPAGLGAALAAARQGAKTLLVERYGFFGGVGAFGMGMPINQMQPGGKSRSAIHNLLVERLRAMGPHAAAFPKHAIVCNVEYLKVAAMDILDAAGCKYLLHCRVADAIVENNRVAGLVLATKQGLLPVKAAVTVDATGDADAAFFAGAATLMGRETDGFLSPSTLCLIVSNINVEEARAFGGAGMRNICVIGRGKYPLLPERMHFELAPFPLENSLVINHAGTKLHGVLDASDAQGFTEIERFSRRQAIQIVEAMREFGPPSFKNVQLAGTGVQTGVRETRRVDGLYHMTEQDAMNGARFEDVVSWRSGWMDIGFVRFQEMQVHEVPYRALLPREMDGLLASGRCISATHVGASSGKSMGNCMGTGHAAGLAAALCVRHRCQPRELNVKVLQEALRHDGVDLEHRFEGNTF